MPKAAYYAVKKGRQPGVYSTWGECEAQTKGFAGAIFKKFSSASDAEIFIGITPVETSLSRAAEVAEDQSATIETPAERSRRPSVKFRPYDSKARPSHKPTSGLDEDKWTVVYTDGACQGNGRPGSKAGIGVWYGANDPRNISERCPGNQTNNRAELIAIIRCLETDPNPARPLLIKTDSSYCIQCVRDYLPGWLKRGWRTANGGPVKNKPVIQHLANLLNNRPGAVKFQHVRGHAGEPGNESADRLAGLGANLASEPERDWDVGDLDNAVSSNVAQTSKYVDRASGSSCSTTNTAFSHVEVDADFPFLSDQELERMARDQSFD